jgi:hypothetical protein
LPGVAMPLCGVFWALGDALFEGLLKKISENDQFLLNDFFY